MSRSEDLIPPSDEDFDLFQDNFVTVVTTNAVAWSIPAGDITDLTNAQTPWTTAWGSYKPKNTRSPLLKEAKDDAREAFEVVMRPFIKKNIRANTILTSVDVVSTGLKPIDTVRTASGTTSDVPLIDAQPGNGNSVDVYFRQESDESGHSRRGLPDGVSRCEFVYAVGDLAPTPAQCTRNASATRSPLNIGFTPEQAGQRISIFGRWVNTRNVAYPNWSLRQECIIPGK